MKLIKTAKRLPRKAIEAMGFQLYTASSTWPENEGFLEACRRVTLRRIPGNPDDRCFTLYKAAQAISSLPGDLIECGSRYGKSSRFMMAGAGIDSDKMLHAFDSFEGLSEPGQKDRRASGTAYWKRGALAASETDFLTNMQMYEHMVKSYKGWIPERFADVADKTFALAHIDVDLYQPTWDSLEFIYPRMVPRGIIVCDDYGSKSCPGAKKAFDEFFADKTEAVLELPSCQALVVKA